MRGSLVVFALLAACSREPAPRPDPFPAPAPSAETAPAASAVASSALPPASGSAAREALASQDVAASAQESAPPPEPPLFDAEGKLLEQTEDEPSVDSPLFRHRIRQLFRAIVADDPELARSFFFPVEAYQVVKAIEKPERDWERRLYKLFARDVHRYHELLGDEPEKAELIGFEPRLERKKWMKPHSEGNRVGYFRMTRNHLAIRDASGKERKLEITSLISWRGEWYLVHLNGFQ